MSDLTRRETHFEFGANWAEFAESIDERGIQNAIAGLAKLIPDISGKTFLDIGSGSGLSALAAIRLGASKVLAIDIDENSVATTQALLNRHVPNAKWRCERLSVFDLSPETYGAFDIVHSWGVLHHTGDMWRAIRAAARQVNPGGQFVLAIYTKTGMCGFWRTEKAYYIKSPPILQFCVRALYTAVYGLALLVKGRNPVKYVREYGQERGMRWSTDAHDWLGGYPYESASPQEIRSTLNELGFKEIRSFPLYPKHGLLGTGCSEYVFERST
jgi:2-polyprenyl-6-hydroxyphenyl methylase/3-demethylubiquinone-9 3-methyltransferase